MSRAILGETFSVSVPVRLESAETLADDCLAADVFFGDDKLPSSAITATLLPGQGLERTVRISTTALINEPVVTLYVIAGCKAKVTRKFVAFADPPLIAAPAMAQAGSSSAGKDSASEGLAVVVASAVSSGVASDPIERLPSKTARVGREGRSSRAQGAGSTNGEAGSPVGVASSTAAPRVPEHSKLAKGGLSAQSTPNKKSREPLSARLDTTPASQAPASRLVLDPVEADAVVAPNLSMSGQMVSVPADLDSPEARDRRAAAAALWVAMSASPEQLARDRIRMQELEQRLAKLQQDAASAREKVVSMEARVREAEDARLSNPMVMGLAGVCVLLAGALGYMVWRQRQRDAEGAWWQPGAEGEPTDEAETHSLVERSLDRTSAEFVARPTAPAEVSPPPVEPVVVPSVVASLASTVGPSSSRLEPPVVSATVSAERPSLIKSEAQEAVREITVEELIDLEQQAEFFVVLGQDDAAVELLESHVQNTAGASPLPYLKLLEIYQRLGRKAQYQQVQADFNGRFNAYAPSWESDLLQGHALEEYPGVVERLQSLWSRPAEAMDVLQKSLTRPDESVETFDLPAYRELLFLYAVARDLSERESAERQPVDLMGQAAQQLIAGSEPLAEPHPSHEPLMATRPVKASPDVRPPSLSLDLSLDDPASGHGALVDEGPLHIDLPEIDAGLVASADQGAGRHKAGVSGNGIEFEHIEIDAPHKG